VAPILSHLPPPLLQLPLHRILSLISVPTSVVVAVAAMPVALGTSAQHQPVPTMALVTLEPPPQIVESKTATSCLLSAACLQVVWVVAWVVGSEACLKVA